MEINIKTPRTVFFWVATFIILSFDVRRSLPSFLTEIKKHFTFALQISRIGGFKIRIYWLTKSIKESMASSRLFPGAKELTACSPSLHRTTDAI